MEKIAKMLAPERIIKIKSTNKKDALKELVEVISIAKEITDKNDFFKETLKREKILSTGIGLGIALPHVKIPSVKDFVMAIGTSKKGIEFDSLDNKPVYVVIMIGSSDKQKDIFLKVLARVTLLLKNKKLRDAIINAKDSSEIMELLKNR